MAKSSFKLEHPRERRQAEAARIREKYPDRIPVIVEKAERSDVPDIDKKKYLVPADLTVGQFVYVVRKRIKLSAEKAIFVFVKDTLPSTEPLSAADLSASQDDNIKVRVAYQAVELWLVDKAVLPIENSVGGSIHRNYDLFLQHRLHIVGEVQMAVNHCLLGLPGVQKEELKRVLSHPQALSHCAMILSELGVVKVSTDDTAGAAQTVAICGIRETGAIASARAAEIYGLEMLAEKIQDDDDNITRFLILAREPIIPGTDRPHKTSIVFSLEEGPGVLFKALAVFALRGINLSKIESRPQKNRPLRVVDGSNKGSAKYFDYLFYIDFEASMAEPRAQNALGHLQEFARFLRVLGCYPMDTAV